MAIVQQVDTFRKYKALQSEQSQRRGRLTFLEAQLARVDAVADIERKLRDLRRRKDAATSSIERSLERGSPIQAAVTRYFNRFVKQILGINGEFIVGGKAKLQTFNVPLPASLLQSKRRQPLSRRMAR